MKVRHWLAIGPNGISKVRKSRPQLEFNEIAVQLLLEIPDEYFRRPTIEARLTVSEMPDNDATADVVVNTVDLIEQQTGAKINFTVITDPTPEQVP